jgi:hypothetical protein
MRHLAVWLASAACAAGSVRWQETVSPHFVVRHESPWTPPGFVLSLEKIHNRLRMDLSMFSPWMAKERLSLYLYKSRETYLAGEFEPPAWSNGLAFASRKLVVVHGQKEHKKLMEVISHETTHLLFEGYWAEAGKRPPTWLNEGLAMMEESALQSDPARTDWYQSMAYWPRESIIPLREFMDISPTKDLQSGSDKRVAAWYVEAYSLVYYLYRQHSRLQFKNFCAQLRIGRGVEESFWTVYRYRSLNDLERGWRKWLADPVHRRRVEKALGSASASGVTPTTIEASGFESFRR